MSHIVISKSVLCGWTIMEVMSSDRVDFPIQRSVKRRK
jgi:hypothetical protein